MPPVYMVSEESSRTQKPTHLGERCQQQTLHSLYVARLPVPETRREDRHSHFQTRQV